MTSPRFNSQISLGNLIQIGVFIATIAISYALIQAQGKSNSDRIGRLEITAASHDSRIRGLETAAARSEEKFTNIISLLSRIDSRLERIERQSQ